MTQPIRVMIADDHPLILLGTSLSLSDEKQFVITGQARNSTQLVSLLASAPCDVLVCDLAMPGGSYGDGLPMIAYIHRHFPHVHLIVQTMLDNPGILKGLQQSGVRGVLNKGDDMALITVAVHTVMKGGTYRGPSIRRAFETVGMSDQEGSQPAVLSRRESEVLRLYVGGATVKEIAASLNRSVKTISTQKMCAMQKLGVTRDADLFKYAQMNGLLNLPSVVPGDAVPSGLAPAAGWVALPPVAAAPGGRSTSSGVTAPLRGVVADTLPDASARWPFGAASVE